MGVGNAKNMFAFWMIVGGCWDNFGCFLDVGYFECFLDCFRISGDLDCWGLEGEHHASSKKTKEQKDAKGKLNRKVRGSTRAVLFRTRGNKLRKKLLPR